MTVKEDIDQKKQSLRFFYQMAQEALDAKDLEQAIEITAKGLEEAELENQSEWAKKFDALNSQVEKAKDGNSLNTSIAREDITVIKGVGPTVAEKLRGAGFHTVESIAEATLGQFTSIPGIGEKTAQRIVEGANAHISRKSLNDFPEENAIKKVPPVRSEIKEEKIINEPQKPITDKTNLQWSDEETEIQRSSHSQNAKIEGNEDYLHEEDDYEDEFEEEEIIVPDNNTPHNHVEIPSQQIPEEKEIINVTENQNKVFREPPIQERHSRQEVSNQSKQVNTLQEKLDLSEKELAIKRLIHTLRGLDFHIVKKVQSLKDLYITCDLIAVKIIRESESLNLVMILPIKLNMLKGRMKVSNDQVKYIPLNEKSRGNGSSFRLLLNSTITKLGDMYKKMQDDLVHEGKLRAYLRREFKVDISLKTSLTKKNLFFQAGSVQHKIFIEPILVCNNEVGFLEKQVPFPYLKDINLHIINEQKLPDLIMFLEDKYTLLEKYSDQKSSLITYEDSFNQFLQVGKKISLPFIGLGFILLMLVIFQVVSMLELVVNVGYALFGVYLTSLAYLYVKFFKTKMEIRADFETPLHRKQLQIDDTNLILINDDLTPETTNQFVYECLGKNHTSPFINKLEESHIKERLSEKSKIASIETELIFEEPLEQKEFGTRERSKVKVNKRTPVKILEEDEMIQKYSSFLED